MADNVAFQSGTLATPANTEVVATDEIAGVDYQIVKLADGTEDSTTRVAAGNGVAANAIRVTLASDGTGVVTIVDGGGSITVDGTVAIGGSVAVTGPLTDAQLRAVAVPVSGTFWQATQPVSGTVTVISGTAANLKAEVVGTKSDNAANSTTKLGVIAAVANAAAPSWTETNMAPLSVDLAGALRVNVASAAITSVVQGTGATNAGKAEDAAHSSGDVGTMALAVRTDTAVARAGTDGDYIPLITDASGRLHVNVGVLPALGAGTALVGSVSASNETTIIYEGVTPLTPKFAVINISSTGTIVAAVASKKIRIVAMELMTTATITLVAWKSGAAGTVISGPKSLGAGGGFVLPYNPVGWFQTATNTLLELSFSGTATIGGSITYIEVA